GTSGSRNRTRVARRADRSPARIPRAEREPRNRWVGEVLMLPFGIQIKGFIIGLLMASGDKGLWGILAAIVSVALVTAVLSSPQAAGVIRAIGESFGGTLRAAMGR